METSGCLFAMLASYRKMATFNPEIFIFKNKKKVKAVTDWMNGAHRDQQRLPFQQNQFSS